MNIFYLDRNPEKAARYLCDKHVVKMPVETAQILSTVHYLYGTWHSGLYKPTHKGHPSVLWAAESFHNYNWLVDYFDYLLAEYEYRYVRVHKTWKLFFMLEMAPWDMPIVPFRPPPQVMPETYRHNNTVRAYRYYYRAEKASFAKWTKRSIPTWFKPKGDIF